MDNNQARFIEDALDLLDELDEGLMQLEANPHATAALEQVFRTMHTIKGGANMFGFEAIGELAHHLETLYDLVRHGTIHVSDKMISLTLQSFDKVRDIFKSNESDDKLIRGMLSEHLVSAKKLIQEVSGENSSQISISKDQVATFFVRVSPSVSITEDGTHPLVYIIKDIEALGTSRIFTHVVDSTVKCWDVFVSTTTAKEEIESYFMFVEGECKIDCLKLATGDLFYDQIFTQQLDQHEAANIEIDQVISLFGRVDENFQEDRSSQVPGEKNLADTYIKVSKKKIDHLLNWISELIILQAQLVNTNAKINNTELAEVTEQLELVTGRLRDTSLEIGLVPIETLVTKFKRLVRDLGKSLGKKVNFLSEGAETELDKDVIELMAEPMIHIIRNAIDHGLETADERRQSGKSEHGTIKLKAFNSSTYANIIISDDGKGIDKTRVLRKAIDQGIVDESVDLSENDILNLIFHPGLSTCEKVSEVSGRGVGMDVVKETINELRGYVTVTSVPGRGTAIHIKLPLSRSIIEGLLVRVDETRYVIPLNVVNKIDRIPYQLLNQGDRVNNCVLIDNELLAVFSLREKFHAASLLPKTSDVITVNVNGIRKGIAVDRIEGKMQTVMKPLGEAYAAQEFLAGTTILGNGSLALVLDPARLFEMNNSVYER